MSTTIGTTAVRLTAGTITQYLASRAGLDKDRRKAILLRAAPVWDGPALLSWGNQQARVATAGSPLAAYELVLAHVAPGASGPGLLVVLTDREESELGADLLARVHKHRVNAVDTWDVVREAFGAQYTDPRLSAENWAVEALLDAQPPGRWPQLGKGVLTRRHALAALALRRLGAGQYDPDREAGSSGGAGGGIELDAHTLLRWSLSSGGPDRFLALRAPERAGLTRFLGEEEQAGLTGQAVLALTAAEHGPDAVAFGLVCAALWVHADGSADTGDYQARGRAERWFGEDPPVHGEAMDALARAFGRAAEEFVVVLLQIAHSGTDEEADRARRLSATVLARATALTRQFGAERAAGTSPVLTAGLDATFKVLGLALTDDAPRRTERAIQRLTQHRLARTPDVRTRIERARMAQRLALWLASDPTHECPTVAGGIDRHLAETGWVDLALEHIEAGGDPVAELRVAYAALCTAVRARRKEIDRHFASALATWTASGSGAGSMLTVESFLSRVIAPAAEAGEHRVLLVVLDGMSAAIAAELGEELRRDWAEFDPLPGVKDAPRRRGMVAALPTVTAVSRTSLFAGRLLAGSQREERALVGEHAFWGGRKMAVFHKDDLRAETGGDVFGPKLDEALAAGRTHVAVVLNTVDDRLAKEQKLGDAAWRLRDIGGLRELLQTAARYGWAVVLTSDHGHVVDRHGERVDAETPLSARHRVPGGPLRESEILLSGPRVVSPDTKGSIVALWDADSRYTAHRAGYHGGASLAEVAIPIMAFLSFGATPPKGWRELGRQHPAWWSPAAESEPEASTPVPHHVPAKQTAKSTKQRRHEAARVAAGEQSLFEMAIVADGEQALLKPRPVAPGDTLVPALLSSELFLAQKDALARKPDLVKIEKALRELLDAGGTLPVTALAQRVGITPLRADGFSAVLRQLLNFDGIQVLETLPDGRTLRLNPTLLREQFELR
ncbi:BREX-2 system phosphatase PglZ [Embleya sp. NPDC050493]|uniref:BREX-2 system phosphatase PglZ n=1 Tax=Embleya sp. NPDC050493 TaxID=3363989 RepID=UPI0037B25CDE